MSVGKLLRHPEEKTIQDPNKGNLFAIGHWCEIVSHQYFLGRIMTKIENNPTC
jgi:hypothetical protein